MSKPTAVPAATPIATKMGRCSHRFAASGRQCRLLTSDPSGLCAQHLVKHRAATESDGHVPIHRDFADLLFSRADGLKTAQGINHSLTYLYELLARDLISVRRAQTLAYISSLVLRTLPAIDHDNARGITPAAYQAALAKRGSANSAPNSSAAAYPHSVPASVPAPAVNASASSPVAAAPAAAPKLCNFPALSARTLLT